MLSDGDKKELLRIARRSIEEHFKGQKFRLEKMSVALAEDRGAFVTLKKRGQLRGCIGYVNPIKPLGEAVANLAVDAAIHDPRFPSLERSELDEVDIEISAMTPLEKITDASVVEVGKHGLYMKRGPYAGLLLPQVATEWGWGRERFLEQTCYKAGLGSGAWKDKETEIYIFSAEVFGEKDDEA